MPIANKKVNVDSAKIVVDSIKAKKQIAFISEKSGESLKEIIMRLVQNEYEKLGGLE